MNIVWLYLSKKLYYVHELFFLFPSDALYCGDPNKTDSKNLQNSLTKQKIKTFGLKQKYFLKSLNTKLDHSPHRIKNETI